MQGRLIKKIEVENAELEIRKRFLFQIIQLASVLWNSYDKLQLSNSTSIQESLRAQSSERKHVYVNNMILLSNFVICKSNFEQFPGVEETICFNF